MSGQIALLLDGLILIFLCVTIFYAARLSMFLKTFREGRAGMQILIRDLTTTIAKAEVSITTTKRQMSEAEQELRTVINEAKFLSDELRYMNEGGDSLANRLEKLADRNRELIDLMEKSGGIGTQTIQSYDPAPIQTKKPYTTEKSNPSRLEAMSRALSEKVKSEKELSEHNINNNNGNDNKHDVFNINDFDIEEGLDDDDEMDFQALEDGAYRAEMAALSKALLSQDADHNFDDDFDDDLKEFGFDEEDDDRAAQEDEGHDAPIHKSRVDTKAASKVRSFAIFDREIEEMDIKEKIQEKVETQIDQNINDHSSEFYSKAEQDLYEALQRRKKMKEQS